ncbi:MAG: hypothetical protein KAI24_09745 [Planctomycetes bacterium]|nr:hypothetical protein [Planctomycetota bacterium]
MLRLLPALATGLLFACTAQAQAQLRLPDSHPDHGLPDPEAVWLPYADDPDHPCNRIWAACYLTACVPSEVAGVLPRELEDERAFYRPKWYFSKRPGTDADARLFGGDGRQLPIEGFDQAGSERLRGLLAQVDGDVLAELKRRPRAAVWFQHDLLRLARRLTTTKNNPELLPPLWRCAQRVALPREVLLGDAVRTVTFADVAEHVPELDVEQCVEIERRSTRLFDAAFVQLWSTVHVQYPDGDLAATRAWIAAGKDRAPTPIGTIAVLLQGIVAVDDQGRTCATDLVIEARSQRLSNRDPLAWDNRTTTRDGVDLAMWSLPRRAVRDLGADARAVPFAAFRAIDMDSQELFRDYGTRKHTTYAAQCALCHRRSNTPDEPLAGFSALRPSAKPRPAKPGERKRRAEAELMQFVAELRAR